MEEYELRYLGLFYDDFAEIIKYIRLNLQNNTAADKLLDAVEKAITERLPYAEKFEKYHSQKERKYPYYRIYVGNFVVYYVVIPQINGPKIMEVRRILYKKRERSALI